MRRSTKWRHYGIPLMSVSIIRSLDDCITCQVIHNNDLSSLFTVTTRVIHGCLHSPIISSLVVHWVLNQTVDQPRGLQWTFAETFCRRHWTTVPLFQTHTREVTAPENSCTTNKTRNKHPENKDHEGQHSYQHNHPNGRTEHRRCLELHLPRKHYQQDRRH